MKKSNLILFLLASFLYVSNAFAQANVLSTGISIQGIARDENNSALANIDQLGLQFKIYYLNASNAEVDILLRTANVKTDNFGVFSYVMSIEKIHFTTISNNATYLKVTQGTTVFSNEKLQAVPYAIQAQNGVPSGTIMAYVGATAPEGWLLCDGAPFADNTTNAQLKVLLPSLTTPNLNGKFLRGTGNAGIVGQDGPLLNKIQQDNFKSHAHNIYLNTESNGAHSHAQYVTTPQPGGTAVRRDYIADYANSLGYPQGIDTGVSGTHIHLLSGDTRGTGDAETRPVNYGVTYIIKI